MVLTRAAVVAFVLLRNTAVATARRFGADERGEGVISAAIAVLIMAFLGALMWIGFRTIWEDSEDNIRTETERIGSDAAE
jgi:hypothetical protein